MNVDDVGEVSVGLSATSSLLLSKYSPYTPMFNKGWSGKIFQNQLFGTNRDIFQASRAFARTAPSTSS